MCVCMVCKNTVDYIEQRSIQAHACAFVCIHVRVCKNNASSTDASVQMQDRMRGNIVTSSTQRCTQIGSKLICVYALMCVCDNKYTACITVHYKKYWEARGAICARQWLPWTRCTCCLICAGVRPLANIEHREFAIPSKHHSLST